MTSQAVPTLAGAALRPNGLDWQAFSAVAFPGRRRHDLEAVTAYGAYRRSQAVDAWSSKRSARIEATPVPAGSIALQDWEDEGGAGW